MEGSGKNSCLCLTDDCVSVFPLDISSTNSAMDLEFCMSLSLQAARLPSRWGWFGSHNLLVPRISVREWNWRHFSRQSAGEITATGWHHGSIFVCDSESEVMKIQLNEVVQNCNQQISKESRPVESYCSVLVNGSVGGSSSPLPTRYVSDGTVQATSSQSRTASAPCAELSSTDSGDFHGFDSAVTLDGLNRNNRWNTVVAKKNGKLRIRKWSSAISAIT
ncbi:hypothetical protein J6590_046623 [Homalodisca vitripennis]|nr:hypothetical protein J6590_046623 [Homalodisca vitripennis]